MTDTPEIARIRAALADYDSAGFFDVGAAEALREACGPGPIRRVLAHIDAQTKRIAALELLVKSIEGQRSTMCVEIDESKEARATLQSERDANALLTAQVEAQAAEIERLRKDAERIEVLESVHQSHLTTDMHMGGGITTSVIYQRTGVGSDINAKGSGATVREAIDEIDAAMKEQK
jgi:hypothetical protein